MSGIPGITTVEEAAATFGLAPAELATLLDAGELRGLQLSGGGWLISRRALAAALRRRASGLSPRRRRRGRPSGAASPRPASYMAPVLTPSALPPPDAPPAVASSPPASAEPERRSVPVDFRPDVERNTRFDLVAAAAHLGVDEASTLRAVQQGRLRATRLGREWITTSRDLRDYEQSRQRLDG